MLSPSIGALLAAGAPTEFDDAAIAVALRCWMFLGADTPFKHIRAFPAGGKLTWTASAGTSVETKFIFGRRASMPRGVAIDEYIDRFRAAIARRPCDNAGVVPLSGGRDSRHIFLELCASENPPAVALTVGGWHQATEDGEIAKAIAARAQVKHVLLDLPDSRWNAQAECIPANHFCTLEHWWLENLLGYLRRYDGNVSVYEGAAGDVLSTAVLKSEARHQLYDSGNFRDLADGILDPERRVRQILSPGWYARFSREIAIDRLVRELQIHAVAPNPLASFFVYNRTRRVTALPPTTLLSPYATVWCPYLDSDLWDFLSSLPPETLASEKIFAFHDDAIKRAYPKFADIPFSAKWGAKPRLRRYDIRTILEMGAASGRRGIASRSFLFPRLARGIVDPSFTAEAADLTPTESYLRALSNVIKPVFDA